MGETNENRSRSREMFNLSLQIDKYPRDLLQRFMSTASDSQQSQELTPSEENSAEEIELNLGLSLGGRFGVDKKAKNKLLRSSSVAGSIPIFREIDLAATTPTKNATTTTQAVTYPSLIRTSSLPTETEEEWRKRKELQTLRRMEAKRRRSEKQKNFSSSSNNNAKMDKMGVNLEDDKHNLTGNRAVGPPFEMQSWAAAARQVLLGGGVKGGSGGVGFLQGLVQPSSQGSVESQGGSSSGMSEFDSKPLQGTSSDGEARNPVTAQVLQDQSNQEPVGSSETNVNENDCRASWSETDNLSKKLDCRNSGGREIAMNAYEDMPCVFTKGDGPNGRKIEGILYRYGKGEEVRIMCVCHGSFLSPAEFVKHAGGGNVDNPLRHIVVNPSAAPFS